MSEDDQQGYVEPTPPIQPYTQCAGCGNFIDEEAPDARLFRYVFPDEIIDDWFCSERCDDRDLQPLLEHYREDQ